MQASCLHVRRKGGKGVARPVHCSPAGLGVAEVVTEVLKAVVSKERR